MHIEWNRVTRLSQLVAIVMFVGVFALGFYLGQQYQMKAFQNALTAGLTEVVVEAQAE